MMKFVLLLLTSAVIVSSFRQTVIPLSLKSTGRHATKFRALSMSGAKASVYEPAFKGLKEDIKRKAPFYKSEFIDGFSIKTLSTTFFLFFA